MNLIFQFNSFHLYVVIHTRKFAPSPDDCHWWNKICCIYLTSSSSSSHLLFQYILLFFFIYIKQSILVLTTPYRRVRRSTKYSIECQLSHLGHSLIQIRIVWSHLDSHWIFLSYTLIQAPHEIDRCETLKIIGKTWSTKSLFCLS